MVEGDPGSCLSGQRSLSDMDPPPPPPLTSAVPLVHTASFSLGKAGVPPARTPPRPQVSLGSLASDAQALAFLAVHLHSVGTALGLSRFTGEDTEAQRREAAGRGHSAGQAPGPSSDRGWPLPESLSSELPFPIHGEPTGPRSGVRRAGGVSVEGLSPPSPHLRTLCAVAPLALTWPACAGSAPAVLGSPTCGRELPW